MGLLRGQKEGQKKQAPIVNGLYGNGSRRVVVQASKTHMYVEKKYIRELTDGRVLRESNESD